MRAPRWTAISKGCGNQYARYTRGQWLGFSIAIFGLAVGGVLIHTGHEWGGTMIGTGLRAIWILQGYGAP